MKNDVLGGPNTIDERDRHIEGTLFNVTEHRNHGSDAAASRDEHDFGVKVFVEIKLTGRTRRLNDETRRCSLVQEKGNVSVLGLFRCDLYRICFQPRRTDGIGTSNLLAVEIKMEGEKLARLGDQLLTLLNAKTKSFGVGCLHFAADKFKREGVGTWFR